MLVLEIANSKPRFGRGFGDLIRPQCGAPTGLDQACLDWAIVPKHQHYLCVAVADLCRIIETVGDSTTSPITVAPDILWKGSGSNPFERCVCVRPPKREGESHSIQELVSSKMNFSTKPATDSPPDLSTHREGAVIFGGSKWTKFWKQSPSGEPLLDPAEAASSSSTRGGELATTGGASHASLGATTGEASGSPSPPTSVSSEGPSSAVGPVLATGTTRKRRGLFGQLTEGAEEEGGGKRQKVLEQLKSTVRSIGGQQS